MRYATIFFTLIACFSSETLLAQGAGKVTKSRTHYSTPKVRGHKARIICPVFEISPYPFHSLGFKLGDPFAFTYKFYPNKHFSFAADFGKPASGLYHDYFRRQYDALAAVESSQATGSNTAYIAHQVGRDLVGELKVLYHIDAGKITKGFRFYAGGGWQWRTTDLTFDFEYDPATLTPEQDPFGAFTFSRRTMGPQVVAGIEYAYFSIPVAAFMEAEYFTDLQADPGLHWFEAGVGLRYVF